VRTPDGRHVVHIVSLDVIIILPPLGEEKPFFWFRGHAGSPGSRKDASNRRSEEKPRRKRDR
jgi:hypothetical protein